MTGRGLTQGLGASLHSCPGPARRTQLPPPSPQVLGYGVKSWLIPQLAFLKSLGVAEEGLPALVMARPQVLGSNILRVRPPPAAGQAAPPPQPPPQQQQQQQQQQQRAFPGRFWQPRAWGRRPG